MFKEQKRNIVLGAGRLYFDPFDEGGDTTGELYLGETPGFALSVSAERTDVYSSDTPLAEKITSVATSIVRTATITIEHISLENLALFVAGGVKKITQTAAAVVDEEHTAKQGRWYQLGSTNDARSVSDVAVNKKVAAGQAAEKFASGGDYELDADLGRLYIKPNGEITDGTVIQVDYTPKALSYQQLASQADGNLSGALRWIADNADGENRDIYAPHVELAPSGESALQSRDTPQQISLTAEFLARDDKAALYINSRPV